LAGWRRMWVGGFKQMHPWKRAVHSLAPVRPAVPPRHQLKEDMTSVPACSSVLASLARINQ